MRNLFVICTVALILGVNSDNVGVCLFDTVEYSGSITFTEVAQINYQSVIEVSGTITGPAAGKHGIHIHEFGDIRDNIGSAGSHFNPYNNTHSCTPPTPTVSHLGDLGNIEFKGTELKATIDKAIIIGADLHSPDVTLIGRTVVIHDKTDPCDVTNLGARVAQCVIGYKEGEVGFHTLATAKTTPQAICVLEDMELQIIFEQGDDLKTIVATINSTDYENDIYLSTNEPVDTAAFTSTQATLLFGTSGTPPATTTVEGLSIRISAEDVVNIIGKAVYCVDEAGTQHSCVVGFYNSAYPPATTTTTTTSSSTSATADPTTGSSSSTGDATTGDATSTTTGAANATTTTTGDLTGNATSTTGSTTMTNTTTDASSTSGQAINPALNTTDTSGGAVLGIIFATFILLGLAWYTYVNRGNNQRRIGYFGV